MRLKIICHPFASNSAPPHVDHVASTGFAPVLAASDCTSFQDKCFFANASMLPSSGIGPFLRIIVHRFGASQPYSYRNPIIGLDSLVSILTYLFLALVVLVSIVGPTLLPLLGSIFPTHLLRPYCTRSMVPGHRLYLGQISAK